MGYGVWDMGYGIWDMRLNRKHETDHLSPRTEMISFMFSLNPHLEIDMIN